MQYRTIGRQGPKVAALGLGCMSIGIADVYTSSVRSDDEAARLIRRALDLGMTLLDTADVYGNSEVQVGQGIKGRRDEAVIATKFGFVATSGEARVIDGRARHVREACDASLARLGVEYIDLYYLHRVDPGVPIEETVGAMADLVRQGKVRHLGLSEPAVATVSRACAVHPIAAVQTEYSLWSRDPEDQLLPVLRDLGIALVAYCPLGRGFLGGRFRTIDDLAPDDWRRGNPRFQGDNFARNIAVVDQLKPLAAEKGCTPAQLALAWLLAHDDVIPIPGTSSAVRLQENVDAMNVTLTREELDRIDRVSPRGVASGQRYDAAMGTLLNG